MSSVKGSALMITAVVVMTMVVISGVLLNDVVVHNKLVNSYEQNYQLRYAADAGLEQVKYQVSTNSAWLAANSSTTGFLAFDNLLIDSVPVDVLITDLGTITNGAKFYKVMSTAEIIAGSQIGKYRASTNIIIDNPLYRPRDTFFSEGNITTGFGGLNVSGTVFTNKNLAQQKPNGGGDWETAYYYNDVTAAGSIADAYTVFKGAKISGAATRTLPNVSSALLGAYASASSQADPFWINEENPFYQSVLPYGSYYDSSEEVWKTGSLYSDPQVSITLVGNQVAITVSSSSGVIADVYDLPTNKLIYIGNDPSIDKPNSVLAAPTLFTPAITGESTLNGRLAIMSKVPLYIKKSIRYVDNEGDPAYILTKDDVPTSTNTPAGVSWTAANGYAYVPNPAYNGTSNLHLVSSAPSGDTNSNIIIDGAYEQPYNMELHATILSSVLGGWKGVIGGSWSYGQQLGNFRFVGAITEPRASGIYLWLLKYCWSLSNEYIYDSTLLTNTPAWSPPAPPGSEGAGSSNFTFTSWRRE